MDVPFNERMIDLVRYRLSRAEESLAASKILIQNGLYKEAAGRSYYCVYHTLRSLVALDGTEYKKHAGNITHFHKEYVKPGIFDKRLGDIVQSSFYCREESDYKDFYIIDKKSVEEQVQNAELFYHQIYSYIENERGIKLSEQEIKETTLGKDAIQEYKPHL